MVYRLNEGIKDKFDEVSEMYDAVVSALSIDHLTDDEKQLVYDNLAVLYARK